MKAEMKAELKTEMNKVLSISIAAYNVENYLKKTLDSLVAPEILDDYEVLIIDDGSVDRTSEIAQKYCQKYPKTFRYIQKENGGWGSTVNRGIAEASGKYFKLLDGDDYFDNLPEYIELLKSIDVDIVNTRYAAFYEDTNELEHMEYLDNIPLNKIVDIKSEYFTDSFAMHSCTFKTSIIKDKYEITEHCFYTDVEYVLKSMLYVKTGFFSPLEVYYYRLGRKGQSVSLAGQRKHYKEHYYVLMNLLKIYDSLEEESLYKAIFRSRLVGMVNMQYGMYLSLEPTKDHLTELKTFDKKIKESYREFYKVNRKRIKVFRLLGDWSYRFLVYR